MTGKVTMPFVMIACLTLRHRADGRETTGTGRVH